MTNRQYDILKFLALVGIPLVSVFYASLAGIWGLPRGQEVGATFATIGVFLGGILEWASKKYDKDGDGEYDKNVEGTFQVNTTEDGSTYKLLLDKDPGELETMRYFTLKVIHD